jgi:hypothetical protein
MGVGGIPSSLDKCYVEVLLDEFVLAEVQADERSPGAVGHRTVDPPELAGARCDSKRRVRLCG